jgi:hypothetical protein
MKHAGRTPQIHKHFVGLTWTNGDEKGNFLIQCDKSEYRGILSRDRRRHRQEAEHKPYLKAENWGRL